MTTQNTNPSAPDSRRNVGFTAVILLIGLVSIAGVIIGAAALGESLGQPMLMSEAHCISDDDPCFNF